MKVVTAPEYYALKKEDVAVFLGGGITNCDDWQDIVIGYLLKLPAEETENLVIFNPRRNEWPDNGDTDEIRRQINWEADYIRQSDIFSMYFTNTKKSDQPICFYELGKYTNYKDVISYQEGFTRALDVEFQLEIMGIADRINKNVTPIEHAKAIMKEYKLRTDPIYYEDCDGPYRGRTHRPLRRSR